MAAALQSNLQSSYSFHRIARGPFIYAGTHTHINKLDIRDPQRLSEYERAISITRMIELQINPEKGPYDQSHVMRVNERMLGDVYDFAGRINPRSAWLGQPWQGKTAWQQARESLELTYDGIKSARSREDVVSQAAMGVADFEQREVFVRGSRRTSLIVVGQMAKDAGYDFDPTRIHESRWKEGFKGFGDPYPPDDEVTAAPNMEKMRGVMRDAIRPLRAAAFERAIRMHDRREAILEFPELQVAFDSLDKVRNGKPIFSLSDGEKRRYEHAIGAAQRSLDKSELKDTSLDERLQKSILLDSGRER